MAAGKKTGGRKKGTPNKATAEKAQEIAASGLTPLEYMLSLMRNELLEPQMRLDAAKSAAPYVHPKLANVSMEHSGGISIARAGVMERVKAALNAREAMLRDGKSAT